MGVYMISRRRVVEGRTRKNGSKGSDRTRREFFIRFARNKVDDIMDDSAGAARARALWSFDGATILSEEQVKQTVRRLRASAKNMPGYVITVHPIGTQGKRRWMGRTDACMPGNEAPTPDTDSAAPTPVNRVAAHVNGKASKASK
jgi:hypothetical protein